MTPTERLSRQLRAKGYRLTPQRLAILQIFLDAGMHLSPTEVFARASSLTPGLTEPTVYRTLSFLCDEGILMCTHNGSGNLLYEIASNLHHHLVCRSCGHSIEVEHEALDDLYSTLHERTGFTLDERHVTLFGICPDCRED